MFLSPSGGILSCRWFRAQLGRGGSSTCCKSWFEETIAAAERQPCTMAGRNASSEATFLTNFSKRPKKSSRRSLSWHHKCLCPSVRLKYGLLFCCAVKHGRPVAWGNPTHSVLYRLIAALPAGISHWGSTFQESGFYHYVFKSQTTNFINRAFIKSPLDTLPTCRHQSQQNTDHHFWPSHSVTPFNRFYTI